VLCGAVEPIAAPEEGRRERGGGGGGGAAAALFRSLRGCRREVDKLGIGKMGRTVLQGRPFVPPGFDSTRL